MKMGFKSVVKPRTKTRARLLAARWRRQGYNARIVPYKRGYELYVKRRKR